MWRPAPWRGRRGSTDSTLILRTLLTQLVARPDARPLLDAWLQRHGSLIEAAAADPAARALEGRGRVYVVPRPGAAAPDAESTETDGPEGEGWVVRHYHRGGAVASVLGDRYLRLGTPRPLREYATAEALAAAGVPTPAVIGAAVYPAGPFYRGDLVTRWVAGSRDLAAVLFGDPSSAGDGGRAAADEALAAAGRLLRLAHERGLEHPDLNLKNILVVAGGGGGDVGVEAMVLDLDRARVRTAGGEPVPVGRAARRRMIERFWRSARKWEGRTGRALGPGPRRAFEAAYAAGPLS